MGKINVNVGDLGNYIREQRRNAQISLRQLAKLAGVSNPYLSQIERGLRKPSAEILQQIAKALRISAEALYVQAGILEERYGDSNVPEAVLSDLGLTERQKHVLLEIYESFRKENDHRSGSEGLGNAEPAARSDLEEPPGAEPAAGNAERMAEAVARRLPKTPSSRGRRRSPSTRAGSSVDSPAVAADATG